MPTQHPHSHTPLLGICLLLMLLAVPAVSATSISFSNINWGPELEFEVYRIADNVSLVGVYNTSTSGITLESDASYMVVMRPSAVDRLTNPVTLVQDLEAFARKNFVPLFALAVLLALVIAARRR